MSYFWKMDTLTRQKEIKKANLSAIGEKVTSFFWDIAPENGFELREGQQDMSFEIMDALIHDQHFAVEAGVGIGKSFGYLVPALLYNKMMQKPVIVATSTIALQEQLWKDIHDVMPLLNLQPEVILAKGQTHYLCHKRANEYLHTKDAVIPKELREGIEKGFEERKQFPAALPQNIWDKVNVQRYGIGTCGFCSKKCVYHNIRFRLRYTAGIILCNQDFLTAHLLQIRREQCGLISRDADLIIVDEAHNLEDKVRNATTKRVSQRMLLSLMKSATNEVKASDRQVLYKETAAAQAAGRAFFNCLQAQIQKQINFAQQDMRYADRYFFDGSRHSLQLLAVLAETIKSVAFSIQLHSNIAYTEQLTTASDELIALGENLEELIEEPEDSLIWLERRGSNAELVYCPKNTRQIINR